MPGAKPPIFPLPLCGLLSLVLGVATLGVPAGTIRLAIGKELRHAREDRCFGFASSIKMPALPGDSAGAIPVSVERTKLVRLAGGGPPGQQERPEES